MTDWTNQASDKDGTTIDYRTSSRGFNVMKISRVLPNA